MKLEDIPKGGRFRLGGRLMEKGATNTSGVVSAVHLEADSDRLLNDEDPRWFVGQVAILSVYEEIEPETTPERERIKALESAIRTWKDETRRLARMEKKLRECHFAYTKRTIAKQRRDAREAAKQLAGLV